MLAKRFVVDLVLSDVTVLVRSACGGTRSIGEESMTANIPRIITKKELRLLVPFSPQHILRLEKRGQFPKRIRIGERRVGWWLHEVMAWIDERSRHGLAA